MANEHDDWCGSHGSIGLGSEYLIALGFGHLHALPRTGLWSVKAVQAFLRLGAQDIDIQVSRTALFLSARLKDGLSFADIANTTFVNRGKPSAKAPLQTALLGAVGKGFRVSLEWTGKQDTMRMRLHQQEAKILDVSSRHAYPYISMKVSVEPVGWLQEFTASTDFSVELNEIRAAVALCPVPVRLDGEPCDQTHPAGARPSW